MVSVLAPSLSALLFLEEESTFPQQDLNNCAIGVLEGVRIAARGHLRFEIEAAIQRDLSEGFFRCVVRDKLVLGVCVPTRVGMASLG